MNPASTIMICGVVIMAAAAAQPNTNWSYIMPEQYDNKNSGALFKNEKRETDSHPNAKGSLTVECPHCQKQQEYWASAWTNTSKSGQRYQSLKITAKDAPPVAAQEPAGQDDFNDDIPF